MNLLISQGKNAVVKAKEDVVVRSPFFSAPGFTSRCSSSSRIVVPESEAQLAFLKDFDLNEDYGPCVGLTRLERYHRAGKPPCSCLLCETIVSNSLNPPAKVLELVTQHRDDVRFRERCMLSLCALLTA
jgi:hypothetical protein